MGDLSEMVDRTKNNRPRSSGILPGLAERTLACTAGRWSWRPTRRLGWSLAALALAGALLAPGPASAQSGICNRSATVQAAILAAVSDSACADVDSTDLAGITSLNLANKGITSLNSNDFNGMSGLTTLRLSGNALTSLPSTLFSGTTSLAELYLNDNSLSSLSASTFATPDSTLTDLDISKNSISNFDDSFFTNFTALDRLWIFDIGDNSFANDFLRKNTSLQTGLEEVYFGAGTGYDATNRSWTNRTKSVDLGGLTYSLQEDSHEALELQSDVFTGMTSLTHVSLNRTGITCLPTIPSSVTSLLLDDGAQSNYANRNSGRAATAYPSCPNGSTVLGTPPTSVSATANSGTSAAVTWTYSNTNPQTGFKVRYRSKPSTSSSASDGSWSSVNASGNSTRSATLNNLTPSTAYEVQVASSNSLGDSGWSSSALTRTYAGVCDRTAAVRDAIVAAVDGVTACANVTGAHLGSITTLSLASRSITALAAGDFADLTALTTLQLDDNELVSLPSGVFDPLVSLSTLELHNNRLTGLPASIFARNTELVNLRLDANEITATPSGVFDNNTKLANLRLTGNRLTTLPAGIFTNATAITLLALNHNNISSLPSGLFDTLTELDTLALSDNALTSLPEDIFDNNTDLEELGLSGNPLTLRSDVFEDNTALERIYLGGFWYRGASNKVDYRVLTSDSTPNDPQWIPRARLATIGTQLHALDADPAGVATLPNALFSGLTSLTHLSLDHVGLTCLPAIPSNVTNLMLDADVNWTLTNAVPGRAASSYPLCSATTKLLTAPTSLSATATGLTTATVSWTAPTPSTGLTSYRIRYRSNVALANAGDNGTWTETTSTTTTKALTGLTPETVYEVQVGSVSATGDGPWSGSATMTTETVCSRTEAIRSEIVAAVTGKTACGAITDSDLAGITTPFNLAAQNPAMPHVASLQAGDFDGLTGLTFLDLSGNSISSLPAGIFDELTALTTLRLSFNRLSSLPTGVFDNNTGLETLWLFNNGLTSLPSGVFDNNTDLQTLWLQGNHLTSLNGGVFDNNTALTQVWLTGNQLTQLPADIFKYNTALTDINLVANRLTSLPANAFDTNTALTTLLLSVNELSSIPSDAFDTNTALVTLGLANNRLTSLPSFAQNTALTHLFLAGNQLTSLPSSTFSTNTALLVLDISGNRLTTLPATLLSANTALTTVHLHNPGLTALPSNLLSSNTSLTAVYLGGFWHAVPTGFGTSMWRQPKKPVTIRGVEYAFDADPASITVPPSGLFTGLTSLTHVSLDRSGMLCKPTIPNTVTHHLLEDTLNSTLTDAKAGRGADTYPACTSANRLPAPPTGLQAQGIGTTSRTLSWTAPSGGASALTGYKVRYRTKAAIGAVNSLGVPLTDSAWTLVASPPASTDTSFTIDGLTATAIYELQMSSVSSQGDGPWSASATVVLPTPPPAAPTPAPALPTFDDTVGNRYELEIGKLAAAGITNGCAPRLYCPDRLTTRAEMAAFLDRALDLPEPADDYQPFDDIEGHVFADSIRAIAAAGITLGCNSTSFCPSDKVSRAHTSAFLVRGWKLRAAPLGSVHFDDIDGHFFAQEIRAAAYAGIASGCDSTGTIFCPDRLVRRDEMAGFLARAAGL